MGPNAIPTSREKTTEETYENFGLQTDYAEAEIKDLTLKKRQWHYGHDFTGNAEVEVDGETLEYQVLVEEENEAPEAHFYEQPEGYIDVDAEDPIESIEIDEFDSENLEESINQALTGSQYEF